MALRSLLLNRPRGSCVKCTATQARPHLQRLLPGPRRAVPPSRFLLPRVAGSPTPLHHPLATGFRGRGVGGSSLALTGSPGGNCCAPPPPPPTFWPSSIIPRGASSGPPRNQGHVPIRTDILQQLHKSPGLWGRRPNPLSKVNPPAKAHICNAAQQSFYPVLTRGWENRLEAQKAKKAGVIMSLKLLMLPLINPPQTPPSPGKNSRVAPSAVSNPHLGEHVRQWSGQGCGPGLVRGSAPQSAGRAGVRPCRRSSRGRDAGGAPKRGTGRATSPPPALAAAPTRPGTHRPGRPLPDCSCCKCV